MNNETRVRITGCRITGKVGKIGRDWYAQVTYDLDGGGTQAASLGRFSTKKALVAYAAEIGSDRNIEALFEDGKFWGTRTTISIGGAR